MFLSATIGSFTVFSDFPIFIIFGILYVSAMLEANKMEKKLSKMLTSLLASSIAGWGTSTGVKALRPEWYEGDGRIAVMMLCTIFAYTVIVFFLKNDTVAKYLEKKLNSKKDDDIDSSN